MQRSVVGVVCLTGLLAAVQITFASSFEPHGSGQREPVDAVLAVPGAAMRPVTFAAVPGSTVIPGLGGTPAPLPGDGCAVAAHCNALHPPFTYRMYDNPV